MGTLRGECERVSRKNVDPNVMKAYEDDKKFLMNYLTASVVEGLLHFFDMNDRNGFPQRNVPPVFNSDLERNEWVCNTLGDFVDEYVFPAWSGKCTEQVILEGMKIILSSQVRYTFIS